MTEAGTIRRYKVATAAFLDWAHRSHQELVTGDARKGKRMGNGMTTIDIDRMILDLVQVRPVPETEYFLKGLKNALSACHYAILLRVRVGRYYPADGASTLSHEHFVERLKHWRDSLKAWAKLQLPPEPSKVAAMAPSDSSPTTAAEVRNIYDALEVDDELDHELDLPFEWSGITDADIERANRSLEISEEHELNLTLACLLEDMDEILGKIHSCWLDVKENRVSLMTATTVSLVGMRLVSKLNAMWLLKYPSMQYVDDIFLCIIHKWFPSDEAFQRTNSIEIWGRNMGIKQSPSTEVYSPATVTYQRGGIMGAFKFVSTFVQSFCDAIPNDKTTMVPKRGIFGPTFEENNNPLRSFSLDKGTSMFPFIMYEMAKLRNFYILYKANALKGELKDLFEIFFVLLRHYLEPFSDLFDKKKASIRGIFAVLVWIASVYALQGQRRISKCFSLTKFSIWNIQDMLGDVFAFVMQRTDGDKMDSKVILLLISQYTNSIAFICDHADVFVKNPIFSGAVQLNFALQYLNQGFNIALCYSNRLRIGCQIYHALSSQGLLDQIPLLEGIVNSRSGRKYLFWGNKPESDALYNTFLRTGHLTVNAIKRVKDMTTEYIEPRAGGKVGHINSVHFSISIH